MATRKKVTIGDFDLEAFRKQKEAIVQAANETIAAKIELIKVNLQDIKDIAEAAEVEVDVEGILSAVTDIDPEYYWNHSSC